MEAKMFEHQDIIQLLARERHQECLAEMESIRKIRDLKQTAPPGNRRLKKMMLTIADLLIAIGGGLKKRFGADIPGGDAAGDDSGHTPAPHY